MRHPTATLSTGLRVANFSSPHSFRFEDGTELTACDLELSKSLNLEFVEVEHPSPELGVVDIELRFEMTEAVATALQALNESSAVDIVIVPLPVMTALKSAGMHLGKARVCRVVDRTTKVISTRKFCI